MGLSETKQNGCGKSTLPKGTILSGKEEDGHHEFEVTYILKKERKVF